MHCSFHACIWSCEKCQKRCVCTHNKNLYHWLVSIDWTVSLFHPWLLVEFVRTQHIPRWFCRSIIYNIESRLMHSIVLQRWQKNNWQALFRVIHTCTNQSQCTRLKLLCNAKSHLMLHRHCEAWSVHSYHGNNLWWAWLVFSTAAHMYINVHCRFQHWKKDSNLDWCWSGLNNNTRCHKNCLELITWHPANWIAQNVSPDGTLNCWEHTLPCLSFLEHTAVHWRQDNSDSWAQECEGYALSTKTLRSHLLRN